MTIFSVDVETSGLNPIFHEVTAISVIADNEACDNFTCRIADVWRWDPATKKWAEENIPNSVATYPEYRADVACDLIDRFVKQYEPPYTFMAWPASFDYPFVQKLYYLAGFDSTPFHYRTVDIHSLLVGKYGGDISKGRSDHDLPGIVVEPEPDKIHDPYYDALAQLQIYRNILAAE